MSLATPMNQNLYRPIFYKTHQIRGFIFGLSKPGVEKHPDSNNFTKKRTVKKLARAPNIITTRVPKSGTKHQI